MKKDVKKLRLRLKLDLAKSDMREAIRRYGLANRALAAYIASQRKARQK